MTRTFRELTLSILLAIMLFLGMDSLTARSYIDGPSMEPTLYKGQILMISRLGISGLTRQAYAVAQQEEPSAAGWVPPRGTIVTFVHPEEPGKILVKRVIGLPGEEISIDGHGVVHINGQPLEEPYVVNHDRRAMRPTRIPNGSVFMMGDNRPMSADSRFFGPVPRANLIGVAVLRYWPLSNFHLMLNKYW